MYLAPADHSPIVGFGEMASFTPFDGGAGVTVATTSTTHGANLLVSGVSAKDKTAKWSNTSWSGLRRKRPIWWSSDSARSSRRRDRCQCAWRRLRPSRLRGIG